MKSYHQDSPLILSIGAALNWHDKILFENEVAHALDHIGDRQDTMYEGFNAGRIGKAFHWPKSPQGQVYWTNWHYYLLREGRDKPGFPNHANPWRLRYPYPIGPKLPLRPVRIPLEV